MLGGKWARAKAFARTIILFAAVEGSSSLFAAISLYGSPSLDVQVGDAACEITTEEIDVCGKKETITRLSTFPSVTDAMALEAAQYPILKEEYERHNACVSSTGECQPLSSETGGEEIKEKMESDAAGDETPRKIRFHLSVTGRSVDEKFIGVRDDAALLVKKGFARDFVMNHHLIRIVGTKKFHEDAEGVALVNQGIVDKEKEELEKQAEALAAMRALFLRKKDKLSEVNTEGFETIARNRALELKAVSCELGRIASKDRRIENRIAKVIVEGELTPGKYGQGSPNAPSPNPVSDISGVNPGPGLPDSGVPMPLTAPPAKAPLQLSPVDSGSLPLAQSSSAAASSLSGASRPPAYTGGSSETADDPLAAFGTDPDQVGRFFRETASAPEGVSEENDALFDRVHRQYRARYQQGHFRQSLVD